MYNFSGIPTFMKILVFCVSYLKIGLLANFIKLFVCLVYFKLYSKFFLLTRSRDSEL